MKIIIITTYAQRVRELYCSLAHCEEMIQRYAANFSKDTSEEIAIDSVSSQLLLMNMEALINQSSRINNLIISILNKEQTEYERKIQSKIQEYIWMHLKEKKDCLSIAQYVGMSKSAFFRFFKKHYHCSVVSYLNKHRIKQAAEELKTSNKKFSAIAYEYGFESLDRFSKLFKKYMGMSPSEFKKQLIQLKIEN